MLKDFNLPEIFWDYDIVTIDMPSLGYYPALGLYSAGQSMQNNIGNYEDLAYVSIVGSNFLEPISKKDCEAGRIPVFGIGYIHNLGWHHLLP